MEIEKTVIEHGERIARSDERISSLEKMHEEAITVMRESTVRIEEAVIENKKYNNGKIKDLYDKLDEQQKLMSKLVSPQTLVIITVLCTGLGTLLGVLGMVWKG